MMEYISEKLTKSTCKICGMGVLWLRPIGLETDDDAPTFYICHKCKFIGQVGVGQVGEVR